MCGRYGRFTAASVFAEMINAELSERLTDSVSYNRWPEQFQAITLNHPDTGARTVGPAYWGFSPHFLKGKGYQPINATAEKLHTGMYKHSYQKQRCAVPADFYIEWQGDKPPKQPFRIQPRHGQPFFFAGLWAKASDQPKHAESAGQVTFAIITGAPNQQIQHLHNRRPLILTEESAHAWMRDTSDLDALDEILANGVIEDYDYWPISSKINSPKNDGPELVERTT